MFTEPGDRVRMPVDMRAEWVRARVCEVRMRREAVRRASEREFRGVVPVSGGGGYMLGSAGLLGYAEA